MLPIIGPTDNSNSPLTDLQSGETEEETSSSEESGETEESSSGNGAESAVKLDLGSSGEDGVHQETARFIAERSIQVQISQSFSFSQQNIAESTVDSESSQQPNLPEEQSARNIAGEAERFLPGFLEESEAPEENAREEFQQIISDAVEEGIRNAREELGGGLDSEIETLFQNIETALDRFIEIFGEVEDTDANTTDDSSETSGTGEDQTQEAEEAIENQNQQAAVGNVPENLSGSLIPQ